ncbi:VOC family protein [candidate division CSSED10-310 bacterium]|uniref:VOC family protein n=1 Tax=candidate division CSSED10-310 bacterium TaxID=2855610 RepID=A0ABV6YRL4_UNCC1
MIKKVDHIAIAVENLAEAVALFECLLDQKADQFFQVPEEGADVAMFNVGDMQLALVAPLDDTSPLAPFLKKRGAGLHHICFETDNLHQYIQEKKAQGIEFLDGPKRLGIGKEIIFTNPGSTAGVLLEFVDSKRK